MNFNIRMGIPEMQELWLDLQEKYRSGNIKKKEEQLYKKWGKALKLLSADPGYPSLQTHEIEPLSRRYGMKVWQSYLENKTSGAMRMYWVYGPDQKDITTVNGGHCQLLGLADKELPVRGHDLQVELPLLGHVTTPPCPEPSCAPRPRCLPC